MTMTWEEFWEYFLSLSDEMKKETLKSMNLIKCLEGSWKIQVEILQHAPDVIKHHKSILNALHPEAKKLFAPVVKHYESFAQQRLGLIRRY